MDPLWSFSCSASPQIKAPPDVRETLLWKVHLWKFEQRKRGQQTLQSLQLWYLLVPKNMVHNGAHPIVMYILVGIVLI